MSINNHQLQEHQKKLLNELCKDFFFFNKWLVSTDNSLNNKLWLFMIQMRFSHHNPYLSPSDTVLVLRQATKQIPKKL